MTNAEAQRRAIDAVNKVYKATDCFDGGSWASNEIMNAIRDAIKGEFVAPKRS